VFSHSRSLVWPPDIKLYPTAQLPRALHFESCTVHLYYSSHAKHPVVIKKGCIYSSLSASKGYRETAQDRASKQRPISNTARGDVWLQLSSSTWAQTPVSQNTANHGGQKDIRRSLGTFMEATSISAEKQRSPGTAAWEAGDGKAFALGSRYPKNM